MPYAPNTTREGVNVQRVRQALEAAKTDPLQILQYLEYCLDGDNGNFVVSVRNLMQQMKEAGNNVTTLHAYRYLFRSADYIADHDLLRLR